MHAANRVAFNTGILYIRMAVTVFISLYATRLVLNALGVQDFGLFNLVGGLIAMLGFLNGSMAAATQRFISFAQGANDLENIKRIFNVSIILHILIAIMVVVVFEIAGYFFFNGILNIAPERLHIAKIIYQFMVVSTLFTIISVPYEAVITSHENMTFYAILGIIEAILKLAVAFYISYSTYDHLMTYGFLLATISILLLIVRRVYCHRNYPECEINFRRYYDKPMFKNITSFAGWSLLGTAGSMIANYGQGIVINLFFGTIVNAAQGIANQISGQLGVFSTTLIKALNPIIAKSEGAGNRELMIKATIMGSKVSFFLMMVLHIPFLIEMPYILALWLKNVPAYAVIFCRLLLIRNLIEQLFIPLVSSLSAQGNIKGFQIASFVLLLFPLTLSYILFSFNYPPYSLYIIFIIYSIMASCIILYYTNKNFQLSIRDFLINVLLRCLLSFVIVFSVSLVPFFLIGNSLLSLITVACVSTILFIFTIYFIGFTMEEREKVRQVFIVLVNKIGIKIFNNTIKPI